jgi:hypothetical protein
MAKVKIKGFSEFIELDNKKAEEINRIWLNDKITDDQKISVKNFSIKKRDIISIILDEKNERIKDDKLFIEYQINRAKLLSMSPEERALCGAWGYFDLFYYGIFQKKAPIELKEKVIEKSIEFFKKNPERTLPSCLCWYDVLDIPKSTRLNESIIRLLERIESSQIDDINNSNKSYHESLKLEKKEEDVLKDIENFSFNNEDIALEDLPF